MRRRWLLLLCVAWASLCCAEDDGIPAASSAAPPLVEIGRQGYAFDYPRVLAQQRLFGIVHGVDLLGAACRDLPPYAAGSQAAVAAWRGKYAEIIATTEQELAKFYFGRRAAAARPEHLVSALNLREQLGPDLSSTDLEAACASLPQALAKPRYDLDQQFQLAAAVAKLTLVARIETQLQACRPLLSTAEYAHLLDQHALWLEDQESEPGTAHAWLLDHWTALELSETPQIWLGALRTSFSRPTAAACRELAGRLATPDYNLSHVFAPAPEPILDDAPLTAVIADDASPIDATTGMPEAALETAPAPTPQANLFDLLLKALDGSGQAPQRPHNPHP